jgi:hypothetical protein
MWIGVWKPYADTCVTYADCSLYVVIIYNCNTENWDSYKLKEI